MMKEMEQISRLSLSDTAVYKIIVQGCLSERCGNCFPGLTLSADPATGQTTLYGRVADQAALHGIFIRIRDLGLPILSVRRVFS